jgi:signal transduction histidine kinase
MKAPAATWLPDKAPRPRRLLSGSGLRRFRSGLANLTLARRFLLVSLAVVVFGGVSVGWLLGQLIETSAINRTTDVTALYVESFVAPELQSLRTSSTLTEPEIASLQTLMSTGVGQRIVTFRIWSTGGTILYCPTSALIGHTFPMEGDRGRAAQGAVTGDISSLTDPENVYERQHWSHLLEIYMPIRASGSSLIIAVAELYQLPDDLEKEVNNDHLTAWGFVAVAALLAYLALAFVVRQGSRRIVDQDADLRAKVRELSDLLGQNAELHQHLQRAAARTTTLNELERRRIGSDLHDGPSQALAFAMLRLDAVGDAGSGGGGTAGAAGGDSGDELRKVRTALDDALREMRSIAAGLRTPEMERATPGEIVRRAVADHERRAGTAVKLEIEDIPDSAPLATKIALYRIVSEALSNAARHGKGIDVRVNVACRANGLLAVEVSDRGPGFDVRLRRKDGHLGLAGIRERAELLGGRMELESRPAGKAGAGSGTTIRVYLPLGEDGDVDD